MEDDEAKEDKLAAWKKQLGQNEDVGDYTGEGSEELDPRQKKRKQGKDFKGYTAVWPADPKKPKDKRDPNIKRASVPQHYPDYDKKKKEYVVPPKQRKGDNVDEERRDPEGQDLFAKQLKKKYHQSDERSGKDRRDSNIRRAYSALSLSGQRKGDDVEEISMQQARKSYGVGQGKTMASKQKQTKGLGGIGSSQKAFTKRHKAIGAKTGQVKRSVGGAKVIAQTQKRKRAAKMSDMIKGLGSIGQKAIYGGDDSVREQKVTKLNKKQLLEFVKETIKEIIND
jgi:hypothetical protein